MKKAFPTILSIPTNQSLCLSLSASLPIYLYIYLSVCLSIYQEPWVVNQKGETNRAAPLHEVKTKLETTVTDKNIALKTAESDIIKYFVKFGKAVINFDIIIA